MIFFYDVETTGTVNYNKKARDPSQPHLVRVSAIIEGEGTESSLSFDFIIKPDGWEIPIEASNIHGITTEAALANPCAKSEKEVTAWLIEQMRAATMVVAHNAQFDKFCVRIAGRRYGLITDEDDAAWKAVPTFCTMRWSTAACQLTRGRGNSYKWPTLGEAYLAATGEAMKNAHDSVADVRACAVIYQWIKAGCPKPEKGES